MSCQNCYNGCTEIIPDKCTKYTGNNVPELGIENGDSLFSVQQSIFSFLLSVIDGTPIKPEINQDYICEKISQYLGEQEPTLTNIINVILQTACDLQTQITAVENKADGINAAYTLNCISGVTNNTNTHEVLQAVITKLCSVNTALSALSLNVSTNYVKLSELNSLIASYLAGGSGSVKMYNKMIPYTVVEYYGNLAGKFDSTGAGLGEWEKIYLCNGNNGTPDKRGRSPIGAIQGMGGGALDSQVDPGQVGNINYALNTKNGANRVTLTISQLPSHTHTPSINIVDPGHTHFTFSNDPGANGPDVTSATYPTRRGDLNDNLSYRIEGNNSVPTVGKSSQVTTGITINSSNSFVGGGDSHNNVHPVVACYYIMYIPS